MRLYDEAPTQFVPTSTRSAEATPPRAPRRMALVILGAYLLLALIIAIGVWVLLAQDRERETRQQETELASLARALQEHVSRTFGEAGTAADSIAHALDPASQDDVRDVTGDWLAHLRQVSAIALFSPERQLIAIQRQRHVASSLQAPGFAALGAAPTARGGLHLGQPFRDNASGRWYVPATRRVLAADGSLRAIIQLLIAVDHLANFYLETRLTPDDSVAILNEAGHYLLHFPFEPGVQRPPVNPVPRFASANAPGESVEIRWGPLAQNEAPRLTVFRHLSDHPLIITTSRPSTVAMQGYNETRRRLLIGAGATLSLLGLMALLSFNDARRRENARVKLGWINQSLEDRVRRRTAELEQTNRELVAFSYTISHDLRAPLRAINGFAHALREDYGAQLDDQGREYLDRIYRGSIRMGELIDELLSLANISRQPLSIQPVDISALAEEIVTELQATSPGREVVIDIQPGMLCDGDEALLRNALYNLLQNAWKFTRGRRPAVISIHAETDGDFQRFVVADNGIGFDMAHARRLFQPFQQLHVREGYGGTGIGLASVRRIVERHGGRVSVESTPDEGARFIFTLPRRAHVIRRSRVQPKPGPNDPTQ